MRTGISTLVAAAALAYAAVACSENPVRPSELPPGSLSITTHTTGESTDLNGYLCTSELGEDRMGPNDTMVAERIAEDLYTIKLTDVNDNCVVARNPIYAEVQPGRATNVQFDVTCKTVRAPRPIPNRCDDPSVPCKGPAF